MNIIYIIFQYGSLILFCILLGYIYKIIEKIVYKKRKKELTLESMYQKIIKIENKLNEIENEIKKNK